MEINAVESTDANHVADGCSLRELSDITGFSRRNIRYYIAKGLLPPPSSSGRYARYHQEHLDRLFAISVLKDMYLPLDEIARRLQLLSPEQMRDRPYLASLARMVGRRQSTSEPTPPPNISMTTQTSAEPEPTRAAWQRFPLGDDAEFTISQERARAMGPRLYELLHMIYAFIDDEQQP